MNENICRFNQVGFCKFKSECEKRHNNETCRVKNCAPSRCTKRHPKNCRTYSNDGFCKFKKDCAYSHTERLKREDLEVITEEMKNIKAELDVVKKSVQTLSDIKQEGKALKKYVDTLKEEIYQIKLENVDILQKIKVIEEDYEEYSDEESEQEDIVNVKATQYSHAHSEHEKESKGKEDIKCSECEFTCERVITLQKHVNTKHQRILEPSNNNNDESDSESEDGRDKFTIEMVNNEEVYACNLCIQGLDYKEEIMNHLKEKHDRVIEVNEKQCSECAKLENTRCIQCIMNEYDYEQ